jgi:hypothetical protein
MKIDTNAQDAAAERMSALMLAKLATLPPVMALAIEYQTAQALPAIYFAHEDVDYCMARLRKYASTEKRKSSEQLYAGYPEHDAVTSRLKDQLGLIANPGNWKNPADPVFHREADGVLDPVIAAWAIPVFQAYVESLASTDGALSSYLSQHIRDTFWMALDKARRCPGNVVWPALSFVHNFDDESDELLQLMTLRAPIRH